MIYKIGDKVIIQKGIKHYGYTNEGSIGIIQKIYTKYAEIKFIKLVGGMRHQVPAVFEIEMKNIELFKPEKKVIKPCGIVLWCKKYYK